MCLRRLPARLRLIRPAWLAIGLAVVPVLAACGNGAGNHGVDSRDVQFEQVPFRVVTIDLRRARLELYWRNPQTREPFSNIAALRTWGAQQGASLLFAANAGIYDNHRAPLGLFIERGKVLVPLNTAHGDPRRGNFSLLPNGVFAIDTQGHATVRTTAAFQASAAQVKWATQSGPMLVIDGRINPQFDAQSDSARWRSGVCARTPDEAVFVISEAPVNFHTFARLFRDRLGCRNALYLDGTISQFFADGQYYGPPAFMVKPYAGMFGVFTRAPDAGAR